MLATGCLWEAIQLVFGLGFGSGLGCWVPAMAMNGGSLAFWIPGLWDLVDGY